MTKWEYTKNFVNSKDIFFIKELNKGYTGGQYINELKNAGFIKKIGKGKYQTIIKIPSYLSTTNLARLAYNEEERKKFMITAIRKQKLSNLELI